MLARLHDDEMDDGPRTAAAVPSRLCVAKRQILPLAELVRFVLDPEGRVTPDIERRLPGRGVWVEASHAVIAQAVKRRAFARGFRREVIADAGLADLVDQLLARAALGALSMANKAGLVVTGFAKVEAALAAAPALALLHASDASADGIRKMAGALHRARAAHGEIAELQPFTSAQMDLALGRSNVIHAVVLAGPAGDSFLARCRRLVRYRPEVGTGGDGIVHLHAHGQAAGYDTE